MALPGVSKAEDLFEDIGRKVADASKDGVPDDSEPKLVDEIESLCMQCHGNGTTALLLTRIPFFREVILMAFSCSQCGFRNSEVQSAGEIQQRGVRTTFIADTTSDLNRRIVKSDTCVVILKELELEIPAGRGVLTNLEGILTTVKEDLAEKQAERKEVAEKQESEEDGQAMMRAYERIAAIVAELTNMASGDKFPFTIVMDDPAGNSHIEPSPGDSAEKRSRDTYARTAEQNAALGLGNTGEENGATQESDSGLEDEQSKTSLRPEYRASHMVPEMPRDDATQNVDDEDEDIIENKVYTFLTDCPGCTRECKTNMKMVKIPHFKEVVIMATVCDLCGYKSNEVKTGGEIPEKGRRITVKIEKPEDLARDILKSESCTLRCPEIDLTVQRGTLGGRFTTVEGLLTQMRDDLHKSVFDTDFGEEVKGDSMELGSKEQWEKFFASVTAGINGEVPFTVILEDPLAGSYVQSLKEVGEPGPDERMEIEEYDRTEEEEEDLGLQDLRLDGGGDSTNKVDEENDEQKDEGKS